MQYERRKSMCSGCALRARRRVWGDGSASRGLAFLGEAPGRDENREGRPFVGQSGGLLNWAFREIGLKREDVYITNVISCWPTDNKIDTLESLTAIDSCRNGLIEELHWMKAQGVRTIVALGTTALEALRVKGSLSDIRGSVMEWRFTESGPVSFYVIPTYHPAYLLRNSWKRADGGKATPTVEWLSDLRKALEVSMPGWKPVREAFNLDPTADQVELYIQNALRIKARIAVDLETSGIDRLTAQIVLCGLGTSASSAYPVPFTKLHGEANYLNGAWQKVMRNLKDMAARAEGFLFQNCFFDVPILERYGIDIDRDKIDDIMLMHHTINPEARHDLGFIVSVYGQTPFWKDQDWSKSIFERDQMELRRYNARDCVVLHQVYDCLVKDLKETGTWDTYLNEVRPLIKPVMDMMLTGCKLDTKRLGAFKRKAQEKIEQLKAKAYEIASLPQSFNFNSDDDFRWVLFGTRPKKFDLVAAHDQRIAKLREEAEAKASLVEGSTKKSVLKAAETAARKVERALGTNKAKEIEAVRDLMKARPGYRPPGWNPLKTERDIDAVDKIGLLSLRIAINNRLGALAGMKSSIEHEQERIEAQRTLDFLAIVGELAIWQKLDSTYTNVTPDPDGRVRARWLMHGTASGRLSCREPNLMNLSKKGIGKEVRKCYISSDGCSLISCDYVNLEAQLLAFEILDKDLIALFESGGNMHDSNTTAFFDIQKPPKDLAEDDPVAKRWEIHRGVAKKAFFARLCYGGSDQGIYRKCMAEMPDLRMTQAEFTKAMRSWIAKHPAYQVWYDLTQAEVRKTRRVYSGMGRCRVLMGNDSEILRQALNHKIQSAGASVINRAMRRVYDRFEREGVNAKFVFQIHDQLVVEAVDEEVERARAILVEEMERPFVFRGVERHVPVESSVGKSLGDLE